MPPSVDDELDINEQAKSREDLPDVHWDEVLPENIRKQLHSKATTKKVHLVVSLILFLKLPLFHLFVHLFSSDDLAIKQKAGNFLRINGSADPSSDAYFPAKTLYRLWHSRFDCRERLHSLIVTPCALELAESESNKGIRSPELRINLGKLTLKDVREKLRPGELLKTYREMCPFTIKVLLAFAASPNKHRRYNLPLASQTDPDTVSTETASSLSAEDEVDDADELEDDGLEEEEAFDVDEEGESSGWSNWRTDPQWAGFARCPEHVRNLFICCGISLQK